MNFPHWQYFLSLEDDLINISKYIEITQDNFKVYSIELTKLFLSICSEVDVVAKVLCEEVDNALFSKLKGNNDPNMNIYRSFLSSSFPKFCKVKVSISKHKLVFEPWEEFSKNVNPKWWKDYNEVKHERNIHYKEANLENLLLSASGLLIILIFFYGRKQQIILDKQNELKIFQVDNTNAGGASWFPGYLTIPRD